tara:strand:- start:100 stop:303 length:204 start_codon:yes stop_codon:yes gene_type:complete
MDELKKEELRIVRKIGIRKMAKQFTELYNTLCYQCKSKCVKNSRGAIDQYCYQCQKKIVPVLDKLRK